MGRIFHYFQNGHTFGLEGQEYLIFFIFSWKQVNLSMWDIYGKEHGDANEFMGVILDWWAMCCMLSMTVQVVWTDIKWI